MLFTIAIPTYNNAKTLSRAVESCIRQEFELEFEVLIINNDSTDNTAEIIKKYDDEYKNVRTLTYKDNVSMWENHNRCLRNAKGDYILFCHSDDKLYPNALKVFYERIKERNFPKRYVLWGHSMFRDFKQCIVNAGFNVNEYIIGENSLYPFVNSGLTPSGTCYSVKSFLASGGFVEDNYIIPCSDSLSMIRLASYGFAFEMMDNMIFLRQYPSTKLTRTKKQLKDDYIFMADLLVDVFDENMLNRILQGTISNRSYIYAYYLTGIKKMKRKVFSASIKQIIKHPVDLKDKYFRQVFIKLI